MCLNILPSFILCSPNPKQPDLRGLYRGTRGWEEGSLWATEERPLHIPALSISTGTASYIATVRLGRGPPAHQAYSGVSPSTGSREGAGFLVVHSFLWVQTEAPEQVWGGNVATQGQNISQVPHAPLPFLSPVYQVLPGSHGLERRVHRDLVLPGAVVLRGSGWSRAWSHIHSVWELNHLSWECPRHW